MYKLSTKILKNGPGCFIAFLATAFLLFTGVLLIDVFILEAHPLKEGIPCFSATYLLRTLIIMSSSLATLLSIVQLNKFSENSNLIADNILNLSARSFHDHQTPKTNSSSTIYFPKPLHLVFIALLSSIGFICLFFVDTFTFSALCREDKVIEYTTAILFILCSIGFAVIAWKLLSLDTSKFRIIFWISILLAFLFFLIGMEEISWFQRILNYDTTGIFKENLQHEMNLHNFATREIENLFYFSSVVFFVIVPNVTLKWIKGIGSNTISLLVPGIASFYSASVFIAYNYDMWNISLIQYGYFLALFMFIYYLRTAVRLGINLFMPGIFLFAFVATQLIIIFTGINQVRIWDFTEYKELFIAFSFFIYCLEVFYRLNNTSQIAAVPH